jgi:nitrite reductase/ring-hydroxylating ferredoxin subunit
VGTDAEITQVGHGTPGGEYLRRHWHPIALTDELGDVPLALTVLGEDLVLFRDGRGQLGLLHRRCSHRGASLEFGVIAERGLRCCYHGWVYDVDGTILETPAEPDSAVRTSRCQGAYPTEERDGLVFAWMGPPDGRPARPLYDSLVPREGRRLVPFKLRYACNWLQVQENTADPMHIPFLHGRVSGVQFGPGFSALPALSFADTPLGLVVASTRFVDGAVWVRTADVVLPNVAQYPPAFERDGAEHGLVGAWATRWITPRDDTSCWVIGYRHFDAELDPHGQGRPEDVGLERVDFAGQTAAPAEERQRTPGDYEAIVGQGPVTLHGAENLVASDRGVVRFRRALRTGIRRLAAGQAGGGAVASAPVPTYTSEFRIAAAADPGPQALEAIGDLVLSTLLETAGRNPDERGRAVLSRLAGRTACR